MPDLALLRNPLTRFAIRRDDPTDSRSEWRAIHLALPVRGRALRRVILDRAKNPVLFEAARELLRTSDPSHPVIERARDQLVRIGLLVAPDSISEPVAFEPWLVPGDDDPDEERKTDWRVAPDVTYQPAGASLPSAIRHHVLLESMGTWGDDETWLLPGGGRIWVRDPGTGVVYPFGVLPELAPTIEALLSDVENPSPSRSAVHRALRAAGILIPGDFGHRRRRQWNRRCAAARAQLSSRRFVNVQQILHPIQVAALGRYLSELVAEGYAELEAGLSHGEHNEAVCRYFHHQLTGLMSRIIGQPVKPSYTYFRKYVPGAVLARHVDREPSHFTISMLVDFSPAVHGQSPWPLHFEGRSGEAAAVHQRVGDGVFFEGMKIPHFRERLADGCTSTSIFFEYVPESYDGPLR